MRLSYDCQDPLRSHVPFASIFDARADWGAEAGTHILRRQASIASLMH